MKANHSTTKEINEPIEKHMSCAGIRSFMNSSKVKGLSSQLLLWKFQYKAELSCDWLTARQWWHTWIPVQLVRSKRNIFLCQLQSPLISVNLHLGSGFPATAPSCQGSKTGCFWGLDADMAVLKYIATLSSPSKETADCLTSDLNSHWAYCWLL